jgi:hypothetical protein
LEPQGAKMLIVRDVPMELNNIYHKFRLPTWCLCGTMETLRLVLNRITERTTDIHRGASTMLNSIVEAQVSDTTGDDSSNAAGFITSIHLFDKHFIKPRFFLNISVSVLCITVTAQNWVSA